MKTYFDKYISEQVQSIEDNLQIDDWSDFQTHYATYKRKKAMRFIIPVVAAASIFIALMLSGNNEISDDMKCINKPLTIIADNVPVIRTEIPVCKDLLPLTHRHREANPTILDTIHNDIPVQQIEAIATNKDEPVKDVNYIELDNASQPHNSFNIFDIETVTEDHHKKKRIPGFSIGLTGSPGIYSREETSIQLNSPDGILSGGREDVSYKHLPPITMGISVGIHFNERFAFITGVDYSIYLSQKEIKSSDNTRNELQQLHYIGLPIRGIYSIYSSKSFEWYVSGGFHVEKYIYGKSGATILKENNLLWSAVVATGIQYNFTNNLSLYCEPCCNYLFSDTALPSYRSDNPFGVSASLGLRIRLFNRK